MSLFEKILASVVSGIILIFISITLAKHGISLKHAEDTSTTTQPPVNTSTTTQPPVNTSTTTPPTAQTQQPTQTPQTAPPQNSGQNTNTNQPNNQTSASIEPPSQTTYKVSGKVTTNNEQPISNVTITFEIQGNPGTVPSSVQTDANGNWNQDGFKYGIWYIGKLSKPGYAFNPTGCSFNGPTEGHNIGFQVPPHSM